MRLIVMLEKKKILLMLFKKYNLYQQVTELKKRQLVSNCLLITYT